MSRILILGGTAEAAELARALCDQGHEVTTSLAGRTREPALLAGRTRIGGFGGSEGLAAWLTAHDIDRIIDATHPFATRISANARDAARLAAIPLESIERPAWKAGPGDRWIVVRDVAAACAALESGSTAFLALGSQHIAGFAIRTDVSFVVRMVDAPDTPLPLARHRILLGKPSRHWREEAVLLKRETISVIVCRNSGGSGAYAKIEAARRLRLPVIMIDRPK